MRRFIFLNDKCVRWLECTDRLLDRSDGKGNCAIAIAIAIAIAVAEFA
jgi:hypothetical protein